MHTRASGNSQCADNESAMATAGVRGSTHARTSWLVADSTKDISSDSARIIRTHSGVYARVHAPRLEGSDGKRDAVATFEETWIYRGVWRIAGPG